MLEFITIVLNVLKREGMQKPDVMWIISVKEVEPFKVSEKCPPSLRKMPPTLKPQPLNPGVMCGPVGCEHICICLAVNQTHIPHINEAWFGPWYMIIHVHKSTFSDPLSPWTQYGHPNTLMMLRNSLRTVCVVLLDDNRIPVIWRGISNDVLPSV